jgi:phage terminase large subunit
MVLQTTRIYKEIEQAATAGFLTISEQGSSRSSKTYNTVIWLVVRCLQRAGTTVSICRASLPALKGSVLRDFVEILQKIGIYTDKQFNKTELVYHFQNGSWVEFFSCDNEQKLRGRKRAILYVNEANELGYLEWQQLKLRTTELSIVDYNPSFSDDHWLVSLNQEPTTYHFITTYKDNPFLEPQVVREIESLRDKNPSLWQIYGLGQQSLIEGLVFKGVEVISEIPQSYYKRQRVAGVDFGYTHDPTAIVLLTIERETSTLYVEEVAYQTGMLTMDIVRALEPLQCPVISESADPRLVDEIHRHGINIHPVKKGAGSIEAGIQAMQAWHIRVTKQSPNVIKEFRNYTYEQDKQGKWLQQPIDMYNHAMDAVRYAVMETVMRGGRKPLDLKRIAGAIGR